MLSSDADDWYILPELEKLEDTFVLLSEEITPRLSMELSEEASLDEEDKSHQLFINRLGISTIIETLLDRANRTIEKTETQLLKWFQPDTVRRNLWESACLTLEQKIANEKITMLSAELNNLKKVNFPAYEQYIYAKSLVFVWAVRKEIRYPTDDLQTIVDTIQNQETVLVGKLLISQQVNPMLLIRAIEAKQIDRKIDLTLVLQSQLFASACEAHYKERCQYLGTLPTLLSNPVSQLKKNPALVYLYQAKKGAYLRDRVLVQETRLGIDNIYVQEHAAAVKAKQRYSPRGEWDVSGDL